MNQRDVDDETLAAAREGEEWALAALYRAYQPALRTFLGRRAPSEADDLAAETWVGVARGLPSFTGDSAAFRSWLFTIARRRVLDERRWRRRHPADPLVADRVEPAAPWSGEPGVAEIVEAHEEALDLLGRLARTLPAAQRDAVLLRVIAGLTVAETAAVLGRSPAAVSVLTHRALRRLAATLGENGGACSTTDTEHPSHPAGS